MSAGIQTKVNSSGTLGRSNNLTGPNRGRGVRLFLPTIKGLLGHVRDCSPRSRDLPHILLKSRDNSDSFRKWSYAERCRHAR